METESPRPSPTRVPTPARGPNPKSWAVQLSSSRRGARLARLLAVQRLAEWGVPYGSGLSDAIALVTAELATNAVRHGSGRGRDFRLRVSLRADGCVRIEVTDACADRPLPSGPPAPSDDPASGNGLLLIGAVASRWGSTHNDPVTKTVWAELCPGFSVERP